MKKLQTVKTIGEAWIEILSNIEENGIERQYTDNTNDYFGVKEVFGINIEIEEPKLPDPVIDKYKDQKEYDWMVANFTVQEEVKELFNANSYAVRLYNYMNSKNQIDWVIRRLKENPLQRSATLTTFEPLTDELYIPCVSLLDFQKRVDETSNEDVLDFYVYARSLDFGTKAYVNMVMLTQLLWTVAEKTGMKPGKLDLTVKSCHYRLDSVDKVKRILNNNK